MSHEFLGISNHWKPNCLFNSLFMLTTKKMFSLLDHSLWGTGKFNSNVESVSMLWSLHDCQERMIWSIQMGDKMTTTFQTTFWNSFSWMKMLESQLKFHWNLFHVVQLAIIQHWFSLLTCVAWPQWMNTIIQWRPFIARFTIANIL